MRKTFIRASRLFVALVTAVAVGATPASYVDDAPAARVAYAQAGEVVGFVVEINTETGGNDEIVVVYTPAGDTVRIRVTTGGQLDGVGLGDCVRGLGSHTGPMGPRGSTFDSTSIQRVNCDGDDDDEDDDDEDDDDEYDEYECDDEEDDDSDSEYEEGETAQD